MYRCLFSFYGGKSKIAHLYPPPNYRRVIEPFAGGASYALRWCEHDVLVNEPDLRTAAIWQFVLSSDAQAVVEELVPNAVRPGDLVSRILPVGAPLGLLELLRAEANRGTQGAKGVHNQVTSIGAACWPRLKPRLLHWIPRIAHWTLTTSSYIHIPDQEATWFVDPPYANSAGSRYRINSIDYTHLGQWCKDRSGQVIVCENDGASWLPFTSLVERRGIKSAYQKSRALEVLWTNG